MADKTVQLLATNQRITLAVFLYAACSGIFVNATSDPASASTSEMESERNQPSGVQEQLSDENITRESMDFLLPDKHDELGLKCLLRSKYFCLMGYSIIGSYGEREPLQNDTEIFKHHVSKAYKAVNWYSFKPQDQKHDGCCTHQASMYVQYGQRNGLSPEQYYLKIFGFQLIQDKKLVFIKAHWNRKVCANMISQLGFGKGELKVVAKRGLNSNFAFPPIDGQHNVPVFKGSTIQNSLSFTWFLYYVVCVEKPDLCPPYMQIPQHGPSGKN